MPIARNIIAAKIQASKRVLQRQIRNYGENAAIQSAVDSLNISLRQLKGAAALDVVRGIEGDAAARYFGVFGQLLSEKSGFSFDGRNRRPPRDGAIAPAVVRVQHSGQGHQRRTARHGARSAGGLFARRPTGARQFGAGYFRKNSAAWWADRLVLSLINRGQIKPQDFVTEASSAVSLKADARKLLFQALQAKKQEKIVHPFLGEEVEIGLLPYIQAMLLARHLRGDLVEYPPFLMR